VTPAVNVHRELPEEELATGISEPVPDRRRVRVARLAGSERPRAASRR